MNQKQRDILCEMLNESFTALNKGIDRLFPDLYNFRGRCGFETALEMALENDEEFLSAMSNRFCWEYQDIVAWTKKLRAEEEKLNNEWNKLYKEFEAHLEKQKSLKDAAVTKLIKAVKNAIVEIQFADDADNAKAILGSLPSIDELMA